MPQSGIAGAIRRACDHSPFLANLVERRSDLAGLIAEGEIDRALALAAAEADQPIARALRRERAGIALAVAIGDLAGLLPFERVVSILSEFADRALDRAITAAIAERTPEARPQGFVALALGKHGSRELNYSSDIDPIFLFDPETLPRRPREEPADAAVRIGRRVVDLLQTRDGDGYVFRVDLRLRPSPEATAIAVPFDGALGYYESMAQPWERAAFIRARAAAGDIALGQRFLDALRPFVWRRALDFGAVGEIRDISRRIRDHHRGQTVGPGYDIKRGRGGIREIEFFAQIHQLIHGGRDPSLRAPATLDALAALGAAGRIDPPAAAELAEAYRSHRTIEHRLQMVDDRQTHSLPADPAALDNVARLAALDGAEPLLALVGGHARIVGRAYDDLDPQGPERLPESRRALAPLLAEAGFADAEAAATLVERWRSGGDPATRSAVSRAGLEAMLPAFLPRLAAARDPAAALARFDDLVRRLPSALNLFRLIEARPLLAEMLADILALAPALADQLGRRPMLLDGLIDATAFDPAPSADDLAAAFARGEAREDYQGLLDRVRAEVGEWRFRLGAQLVLGMRDPLDVAAGYARVAEAALATITDAVIAEFAEAHGRVPGGELVILAFGRFGGGALTHASDLDLVYLFTGDFMAQSDGAKPLGATHYFNRLAQRVSAGLSVPTAAGPLYPVDTRLRPSGMQGLLAVSVESFARYQDEAAWTWEHLALTRARAVYGSAAARDAVAAIIADALRRPRDPAAIVADAARMRGEIARHKPPAGPLDVKLVPGGLVDLEFTTQAGQLVTGVGLDPRLDVAVSALAEARIVPSALVEAGRLLTRMLVALRLCAPDGGEPTEAARAAVARACRAPGWPALLAEYDAARQSVGEAWSTVTGRRGGT